MTTANAPHPAVVALPLGAVTASEWEEADDGKFIRYFDGEERETTTDARGIHGFEVLASGYQFDDGRIADTPGLGTFVFLSEIHNNGDRIMGNPMTAAAARRLADLLVTAADEVDGWVTR